MTAATRSMEQDITRRELPATVGRIPTIRALTQAPRAAWDRLQAGQLGPVRDTELGRHLGARI